MRGSISRAVARACNGGAAAALIATGFLVAAPTLTGVAHAASAAAFATTDVSQNTGACLAPPETNQDPPTQCNQFAAQTDVWLNGGPVGATLGQGTYFWAIVAPGGHGDPNDGSPDQLYSDSYVNREFTVDGNGNVAPGSQNAYSFDSTEQKFQLAPFAPTPNPGGVYQFVICQVPITPTPVSGIGAPGVMASSCKSNNFKISAGSTVVTPATEPTVTKTAAGAYNDTFTWGIQKTVDNAKITSPAGSAVFNYTVSVTHDSGTVSGITVSGAIDVSNLNFESDGVTVAPVTITGITDVLSDGTVCNVDTSAGLTLTATDNSFPYSCTLNSLPEGQLNNTATATWGDQVLDNGDVLDAGSAPFTFSGIAFTSTLVDDCVTVSDTVEGSLGSVCQSDASPTNIHYPLTVTGTPGTCVTQPNTVSFETDDTMTAGSSSQSVTLCTPEDLQVTKNANPSYTRTYAWSLMKAAAQSKIDASGSTATANYSVVVKETGFSDSNIEATGTITVTNPNDFEGITLTGVTDSVNNGGDCSIDAGQNAMATIAASGQATFTYTCTYSAVPANGTNTGTASWDPTVALTPDGSASGTASVDFGAPTTTVNKSVTPTDSFNGGTGAKLCTLTATATPCTLSASDTTPLTSQTYTYGRSIPVAVNQCVKYPNTASLPETGQTSSASVTVCSAVTGGLTMGFWHNNNGQAIITGSGPKTGTCTLTGWLRSLAPFGDLSSTATCSQVAAYQVKMFNAATCSGTCNAMLKSQMLATALNVYFSDPSLGGNKISAPTPLGGVVVELTNVPGAGNVSAAFGGATSMTVSQMLAYAASQSNSGGATWYANNKALETLAQTAFTDVNEGIAFV